MTDMFNYSPTKVSFSSFLFSFPFASPPPPPPLPVLSLPSPNVCTLSTEASNPFWTWVF